MKGSLIMQVVLLLLLLHTSACWGFGFRSCLEDSRWKDSMYCTRRNIANLSEVVSMLPVNTTRINLSKNNIHIVPVGCLGRLTKLKFLDLSENKLMFLKGGEFIGLTLLRFLNLTCNNISHIHHLAFEGLTQLQTIILTHNQLSGIFPYVFNALPAIQEISLSLNSLKSFTCGEFGGSSTLRHLDLFANSIQNLNVSCFPALEFIKLSNNTNLKLQADAFISNPRLKFLFLEGVKAEMVAGLSTETKRNLSRVSFSLSMDKSPWTICKILKDMDRLVGVKVDLNGSRLQAPNSSLLDCPTPPQVVILDADFGDVTQVMLGKGNVSNLDLINCGLKQISHVTFEGYTGLKALQLNQNNVDIQEDAFRGLTQLTHLSIDRNKIHIIEPNWFIPLKKLTHLSLTKNFITELTPEVFRDLIQLEQLYLQFNLLKYISRRSFSGLRKLTKLNLSLNIIDFIEDGSFRDLSKLRYMDLSGNRIKRLTPSILYGLTNLRNLVLYNNRLHFRSYETPFIGLPFLEYLTMDYQGPGGKGIGDIGPHFFQGAQRLSSISLGHSIMLNIHPDAFIPLTNLTELFIEGVDMKAINLSAVLAPLKSLKKLILFRVDLDALPTNLLPPDNVLEVLKIHNNHIHTVNKTMLDALPRLRTLDLSENPISCTCENAWFKTWAINNPHTQVNYLYNLQCDGGKASSYLWQFDDKTCSYDQVSFIFFITCSVMDVMFLCVCLAWHTQGPTLRYLMLIFRAKFGGRKGAAGAKFQYDAFVSYSSKDEAWVVEQLVPNLEKPTAAGSPKLRLCLHHRDFRPGAAVLENIESAIYSSRHTLCVITHQYLQSEWCSVEFQLASLRLMYEGSDVLMLVFLEEIPQHCLSPYTRLRRIVSRKTYLLWPEKPQEQDIFWVRLRDALKNNEEEEEEGARGGEEDLTRLIG